MLYSASKRLGAFVEVLARFRPDPHVLKTLQEIEGEDDVIAHPGELDVSWLAKRRLARANIAGRFADVGHSESLAQLRKELAARVVHYGVSDLDAGAIRLTAPRRFTREISRYVYEQSGASGRAFDGISYISRLGDEFRNWAIFQRATEPEASAAARDVVVSVISPDDADLHRALAIHGIVLVDQR